MVQGVLKVGINLIVYYSLHGR